MEKRTRFTTYDIFSDRSFTMQQNANAILDNDLNYPLFPVMFRDTVRWDNSWVKHINYNHIALEMVLEGAIEYSENGESHIATPGKIFIIVPHSNVKIVNARKHRPRRKLSLLICGNAPGCISQSIGFARDTMLTLPEPETVETKIRTIGEMMSPGSDHLPLASAVYELMLYLAGIQRESAGEPLPEELLKIRSFIHENFCNTLNISDIAEAAGISPATLRRRFARFFHISPLDYLNRLRLERAAALLKNSDLPVKEISFSCGFNSPLYFSEAFRKSFGCAPGIYRKQQ
ncbi:MAG: helix-turn-helix transcriptional regulator [Lentisphaerae bacterium]|nr:helix-turn-helix transcriptional regulator [Lentisphaerota bacterium]MBQ9803767.1 helix-turn-helix transcriptional regulator [Lentisphaeria bacterium]